jgi:deoxycytidylate deaminase
MKITRLSYEGGLVFGQSNQSLSHIDRATQLALTSTESNKHGAIVVAGRKVLGVGCNTFRNNPLVFDPEKESLEPNELSYHAEYNAMKQVPDGWKNLRIYVVRWGRTGYMLSLPCNHCMQLLSNRGVKEIIHS